MVIHNADFDHVCTLSSAPRSAHCGPRREANGLPFSHDYSAFRGHWGALRVRFQLPGSSRQSIAGLLLALLAACVLVGANEAGHASSSAALREMARQSEARSSLQQLQQQVLDAQSAQRAFLLTGDPRYLQPYDAAVAQVGHVLAELRRALARTDELGVDALARDVQRQLVDMDRTVRMRRQAGEDAAQSVVLTDLGQDTTDAIRAQVSKLDAATAARIDASQARVRDAMRLSRIGMVVAALLLLAAWWSLRRAASRHSPDARGASEPVGPEARDRNASLADLATHLQQEREAERAHLARELHDELGALLTAAKLDVARMKSRLGNEAPEIAQRLQHLADTLNSGIALKRRIIEDLRPSSLSNLGLTPSLEILAREFAERSGVEVTTRFEPVDVDEAHQLTIYRVMQESLANVARHAQAQHVQIALVPQDGAAQATVQDDGAGFDSIGGTTAGHGLAAIRHRIEAAGGRFAIDSAPGRGTRVTASLPLRAAQA
ncbi:CHASE3 domain-containing protein [Ramlibacter algicola]|uniref:Oxygen sensor histidine kinase NreB n=1 Tax=Ramlibacter algicola TaxID=2795217 RepID=A0A934Q3K6_9BURK|nr:CHASE3 domain-containing protein [Ramlibacter algicola]MBK0394411.1 CHASE3 domain-containing protein [Ramlibacter algicola]